MGLLHLSLAVEAVFGVGLFHSFGVVEFFLMDVGYFLVAPQPADNRLLLFGFLLGYFQRTAAQFVMSLAAVLLLLLNYFLRFLLPLEKIPP